MTALSALKYSKQLKRPLLGPAPMPWRVGVIALAVLSALYFFAPGCG